MSTPHSMTTADAAWPPSAGALRPVDIAPLSIDRFRDVLDPERYADLVELTARARELLAGRVVWCVNSTARGGGVAEMLRSLLAYTRGAGVDTRWVVLEGRPAFFDLTKRLHNRLHGSVGDGGPLGDAERAEYDAVTAAGAAELVGLVRPGDVVILHDPQTAGLAPWLRESGAQVIWRAHIGVDEPDALVREAWDFLRPYVLAADACVFSRERFVWSGLEDLHVDVVSPSIDVFSAKNQDLSRAATLAVLRVAGILEPGSVEHATFVREDGSPARVDRSADVVQDAPLAAGDPVVAQVSRWDRLKDPVGVLHGFVAQAGRYERAHLLLVGPQVDAVADDPEGAQVLAEVVAARAALPAAARARVHVVSLPMADAEENAAMVNAIQRHAAVVVQKSLAEGFGLTVAEALWKGRPVVASRVGGIQDQVIDEVDGLLVKPTDTTAFGNALSRVLADPDLGERLGRAARERVREEFLEPRHLRRWVGLVEELLVARGTVASAVPVPG
jgi:trehalose synthase